MMRPGGQGPMEPGSMQRRQAAKAELGLTDVQQADIQKAVETARRDRLRKSTDLKIAKMDLRSLLRAEKVDEKAIAAKLAEAQAAEGALMKIKVDTALAMKRILTPEQQKKFAQMREGRGRQRMGQHMMPGMRDDDSDLDLDLEDEDGMADHLHGEIR